MQRTRYAPTSKVLTANVQTWGGVEFVRIPAGKFLMGSKDDNPLAQTTRGRSTRSRFRTITGWRAIR